MVNESATLAIHRRANAAASVVPHHKDVLYHQHVDGELQNGEIVGVLRWREVGDITVDEQLPGIEADDLVGRYAAVGATDPEIFGALLALQPFEEIGIGRHFAGSPGPVVSLEMLKHAVHIT